MSHLGVDYVSVALALTQVRGVTRSYAPSGSSLHTCTMIAYCISENFVISQSRKLMLTGRIEWILRK